LGGITYTWFRLKPHASCDFYNRHRGFFGKQVAQDPRVLGIEMLNQHVSHTCIGRKVRQQFRERFDASGGCADGDNQKVLTVS